MLLDKILPHYHISAAYEINVHAPPEVVYQHVLNFHVADSQVARVLMNLRSLPSAIFRQRKKQSGITSTNPTLADMLQRSAFAQLAATPNEELVIGIIGNFWKIACGTQIRPKDAEDFMQFNQPGFAKAAMNFYITDEGSDLRLTTETRIYVCDEQSLKRFRRYWLVVGPFSGWIRKDFLKRIRTAAESNIS
jgi:hypothetical protein